MTPPSWHRYAAAALARERTPQRCEEVVVEVDHNGWAIGTHRCRWTEGHFGAHR